MIPCDRTFNKKDYYEDDGKIVYRWHHIEKSGDYQINIKIISTNSRPRKILCKRE